MIVFGPIPSRRLGKSLGINNIPSHKICSYSCVYCQIGDSGKRSMVREGFSEPQKMVDSVESHLKKLDKDHIPDYLTFVSNGEPTLDINLGRDIQLLKRFGIPVAVITNSSLIEHQHVRDDLMLADWVSLKVDSVNENTWKHINRPLAWIDLKKIRKGIQLFTSVYKGKLHTETMLVGKFNDSVKELTQLSSFISSLKPEKTYLSVPVRPPAVKDIEPVSEENLTRAWQIYQEAGIDTELLTGFEGTDVGATGNAFDDILNITAVHPLREDSLRELLKREKNDRAVVHALLSQGLIKKVEYGDHTYYLRSYNLK